MVVGEFHHRSGSLEGRHEVRPALRRQKVPDLFFVGAFDQKQLVEFRITCVDRAGSE